jgi:SAM-dependent methyltransferase
MTMTSPTRAENDLLHLIDGYRATAAICVAAKLGIPDFLFESAKTVADLSRLTGTHEPSLYRLMRALAALAICRETTGDRFELTDMGNSLAANSERSLKSWALMEGGLIMPGWNQLIETIRTGKTMDELAGRGSERFEVLAERKDAAALFNDAMVSMTRLTLPALLSVMELPEVETVMDVGGGLGQLIGAILRKFPSMRGIVFDLPHCADGARENLRAAGVATRAEFIAGSFFESVPAGADAIILKSIIHDWNDERCVRILQNCNRALKPSARLVVIDRIVPENLEADPDAQDVVLSDLNMLRGPGGCERKASEFRALLVKSGFRMERALPTGRYFVIEATRE